MFGVVHLAISFFFVSMNCFFIRRRSYTYRTIFL